MATGGEEVGMGYRLLNALHRVLVFNRRVHVLAGHFAETIPKRGTVLDIGTGDGLLAAGGHIAHPRWANAQTLSATKLTPEVSPMTRNAAAPVGMPSTL